MNYKKVHKVTHNFEFTDREYELMSVLLSYGMENLRKTFISEDAVKETINPMNVKFTMDEMFEFYEKFNF